MTNKSNLVLKAENIRKYFPLKQIWKPTQIIKAVDGVSFELGSNETLSIVGESGCGKSTLANVLMQIENNDSGNIYLNGSSYAEMTRGQVISSIQMIFQDPYGSLNPRKKALQIVAEPLMVNTTLSSQECLDKAAQIMRQVGLGPEYFYRYPHMFSGGQRQRIGIARALVLKPSVLICDEPVSALDVSVQAQVINLLLDIQKQFDISYLFISHDLSVVKHLSDYILVMYLGKVMEYGKAIDVFSNPKHPYTQALFASTPKIGVRSSKDKFVIKGEPPSPINPPSGCVFHPRCPLAKEECQKTVPELRDTRDRKIACIY